MVDTVRVQYRVANLSSFVSAHISLVSEIWRLSSQFIFTVVLNIAVFVHVFRSSFYVQRSI